MTNLGPSTHRIAVVEDDPDLLDHFIEIITGVVELDMAGTASSVKTGRDLIKLQPDLFLLDIGLPDGTGIDLIPEIRARSDARILIVTTFVDRETVLNAIGAGADGYLLKDSTTDEIVGGIKATLDGGAPVSAAAATFILDRLRTDSPDTDELVEKADRLTAREAELLDLFSRGLSYKEAAGQMGITPQTVASYVKIIYNKLAVHSRSEAVYEAVKTGQLRL